MNVPLSLIFYNPLEAYSIFLLCDVIIGYKAKFTIKNFWHIWVFGSCNFVLQSIPYFFYGYKLFAIINLLITYFVVPVSVKYFYGLYRCKISYKRCVIAQLINSLFIIVISSIWSIFFGVDSIFYNSNELHEFITNITIYLLQILSYIFVKRKGLYYEKSN